MVGRNDPCPCGSGKKYKKCCLLREMREQAERRQKSSSPSSESAQVDQGAQEMLPSTPPEPAPDSVRARADEMLLAFDEASYEEKWEIIDRVVRDEPELLDGGLIFEIGEALLQRAYGHGELERFERLLDRLQEAAPEAYDREQVSVLDWRFESALLRREWPAVREAFLQFSPLAGKGLDVYYRFLGALAYYGQLDILLEGMRQALPVVEQEAEWDYTEFALSLVDFETLHYLLEDPEVTADDSRLQQVLADAELTVDLEKLNLELAYRSGRQQPAWQASDFDLMPQADHGEDPARTNLHLLLLAWVHYAHTEEGAPPSRAELARSMLLEYLLERVAGRLDGRTTFSRRRKKTTLSKASGRGRAALLPDGDTLDSFLGGLFGLLTLRYYDAVALVQLIPAWIRYLVKLELVTEEQAEATLRRVQGVYQSVLAYVESSVNDPQLAQDLRGWPS